VETGTAEVREENLLQMTVDGWKVLLEWKGPGKPAGSIERCEGTTLVHFDLPKGPLGEYHISVQQPFIDIHRSWSGSVDCWRGSELTSIALNFSFNTAANFNLPVICNYARTGENRGVIGLIDHVTATLVNQRPLIEEPPMHLLQTRFSRQRRTGGFRETVVLCREKRHFVEAIRRVMKLCRQRQGIKPLPAPDWARDPVWCSWYSHLYGLTQRQVEEQIPHLKRLGVRTVLLDASWFKKPHEAYHRKSGDYRAELSLFPDLPGLSRRLHSEGLKLMLWCVPHFVGVHSRKRRAMGAYCVRDGKARSYQLCPFCDESKAYARALVERVMREYELDGLKLDFLDQFGPACADPAHNHGDGNFGAAVTEFMRAVRDGILHVNPAAAIEYRISYSTLATLPFANCHRGNDAPYDADYMRRENLFLRLFCDYPSAIWNDYAYWHALEKPENISLMLGQQIFSGGVPTLSINLAQCGQAQRRIIGRWLEFYRRSRDTLARAELSVHSADSSFSDSSLQNVEKGDAFVLLAGQHVPAKINLQPGIRRAWVLNAGAEKGGEMSLVSGKSETRLRLTQRGPVLASL